MPWTPALNAELFTFTYGALVVQLIQDYEDYAEVNKQLRRNLINARNTQVGFKSFLNITPSVTHSTPSSRPVSQITTSSGPGAAQQSQAQQAGQWFTLTFDENPLAEFVELPDDALEGGLWYSNVLCGVLRGALEMVQMQVEATFVSDVLSDHKFYDEDI
ncbi:TRAPP I complex [Auricularia subglabra TFB-10046 SS5]|uniref:TRAPP I complex n=1 Tax=Auricularia subglabra (strain TFB-10046 / SS5) TaxID=717982 RepID=J0D1V0_AURST|nr:TRAPP I complex [Auricularia subglabra TFB-10046 SS5]